MSQYICSRGAGYDGKELVGDTLSLYAFVEEMLKIAALPAIYVLAHETLQEYKNTYRPTPDVEPHPNSSTTAHHTIRRLPTDQPNHRLHVRRFTGLREWPDTISICCANQRRSSNSCPSKETIQASGPASRLTDVLRCGAGIRQLDDR